MKYFPPKKFTSLSRLRVLCLFLVILFSCISANTSVLAEPAYQGPLFDAHAHLSKDSNPKQTLADFKAAGFEKAVLFADINRADETQNVGNGFFLVFADPFKRQKTKISKRKKIMTYKFSAERLTYIQEKLNSGVVGGFGEIYIRLGWAPFAKNGISTDIHEDGIRRLLAVAKSFNATVHIHLDSEHVNTLKELLTSNPDVRFVLAHCGFFEPELLGVLLNQYPNLFAETSLIFNPYIDKYANLPLENGKLKPEWKSVLIQHADRIMIGTDYVQWRREQLPKLAVYYREVLGLLPKDVADRIAYENFKRLFATPQKP